jgi:hypothetical protein
MNPRGIAWLRMSLANQVAHALQRLGVPHKIWSETDGAVVYFHNRRHTVAEAADALLEGGAAASVGRPGPRIRADLDRTTPHATEAA